MSTSVNGQQVLQTVFNPGDSPIANSAISADQRTTINHEIGQSITTNIANSADNRVIQNTTTVDLFISNLPQVQAQAASAHALTTMIDQLNSHIVKLGRQAGRGRGTGAAPVARDDLFGFG
jgi:hypothetical protein